MTASKSPTAAPASGPGDPVPGHRIVLVDPRVERRAVMNFFVDHCPGLMVVGLAADADEATAQIQAESADVALVEIQMPLEEGLTTIATLRERFSDLRILVCSFLHDSATREAALQRGADGYLAKPPHAIDLLGLVTAAPASPEDLPEPVPGHPGP